MRVAGLAAVFAIIAGMACAQAPLAGASDARCQAALAYSASHRGAAVLALKDGKPICEGYAGEGAADRPMELWSGTKSFVGLMAAAAVQDGLLSLDEPVSRTLPEWKDDPRKARVTLRHLLSLTSGMPSEVGRPPTYADAVAMPLNADPGEKFQYGPGPYQVFGEIMRRKLTAAGQPGDPYLYLKRRILDPIGLVPGNWRKLPNGDTLLPQGAVLTVREWVKAGELVRAGGVWKGKALVDPAAFKALFQGSKANPAYGITWWLPSPSASPDPVTATTDIGRGPALPRDLVLAAGAFNQRLFVVPSKGLTIARLASMPPRDAARPTDPDARWSDAKFARFFTD
jgi:CubicO group peptidase (beta-lactamase class C family)